MPEMTIEDIVGELKKVVPFKHTTSKGDLVLVVIERPQTVFYAQVGRIERDVSKKDEWWHLTLHFLSVPPQKVVWTLRIEQFTGREIFTMGGEKRFIQAVALADEEDNGPEEKVQKRGEDGKSKLRVVK
jgi:hypothetical protein